MTLIDKKLDLPATDQNISYYNEVAKSYDAIMKQDEKNQIIRGLVAQKFVSLVPMGSVIDFGGGTGLDLHWLSKAGYHIYFCEPSVAMREEAIKSNITLLNNDNIIMLKSDQSDFRYWQSQHRFFQPIDGVLSNFGVINYIPDIHLLFDVMADIIKPGGHFILTMLRLDFKKRFKWHRRNAIRSLLLKKPFKMYIPFKKELQNVFVHTRAEIQIASREYFNYHEFDLLPSIDFVLIDLVRK